MLRRSFSTVAVDNGASPKDIQHQMRHMQASMSLYYAKVIPQSAVEEVNRLAVRLGDKIEQKAADGGKPFASAARICPGGTPSRRGSGQMLQRAPNGSKDLHA
jgi:hypothetical protein